MNEAFGDTWERMAKNLGFAVRKNYFAVRNNKEEPGDMLHGYVLQMRGD